VIVHLAFCLGVRVEAKKTPKVLGIDGLSKYLDVSKSTLYKLAQEGKLPGQKVGKHWRFRQATIDRWLDGGKPANGKGADVGDENDEK
jgi:excisionase family DNA binding protein